MHQCIGPPCQWCGRYQ